MALSDLTTGPAPETRGISLTRPRTRPVRGSLAKRSRALLLALDRLQETEPEPNCRCTTTSREYEWNREYSRIVNRVGPGFKCGCIRYAAWYRYRVPHSAFRCSIMGSMHGAGICRVPTRCAVVFETVRRVFSKSDTSAPHAPPHVLHLITQEHLERYRSDRTPSPIRRSCSHDKVLIYMCIIIKLIDREDFAPSCRAALSCARRPGAAARSSSRPRAVQRPSRMLP